MTALAYVGAALAEIAGCFAFWAWLRMGKSIWWLLPGVGSLIVFAWLLTLVDTDHAGRAFAAYGGVYITAAVLWLWIVEGMRPDRWRNGWARPSCCGHWGSDWLTRTTVNYGGIWANVFEEVLYYRGALDSTGADLQAEGSYTLTFPADDLPSKYAKYFWSVIAVDRLHRRVLANPLDRFLLNKESRLAYGDDGSLTLYFAPDQPDDAPEGNWLPTRGKPWSLTFRFYGPKGGVANGSYFPPALIKR